ncbi:hypothetical protein [Fluviicola taffensis]|jgi:hypothetical protein|uniref:TonB C-terminal domain-containing protein n=1 Tax=Fluviicola taffensis (strain DSM 16823 / NCIMB 13979 / RW262) TaxID=755732 RepID=F2IF26_FLUTR|nr:hypothetical protein [Fluviicola taffensis]AEA42491.1 hypothetical protein Fluta_0486 [Fluviicola taffensis DSM 16823]
MKKLFLLALTFFSYSNADSQVLSGTLIDSDRKLLTKDASFVFTNAIEGVIVVELAVNREGKVTATKIIGEQSTIKSTPSKIKAENSAKKLTFTAGTRYAPFEHVLVKYTYKKTATN